MMNRYLLLIWWVVPLAIIIPTVQLSAQCSYSCKDDVVITIPDSGSYTLQVADLLTLDPAGCLPVEDLYVEPATLTCDQAGEAVEYKIVVKGLEFVLCSGQLKIAGAKEPQVFARDSVTFALPPNQSELTIDPVSLVDRIVDGGCAGSAGTLAVEPSVLDCDDVGRPINYRLRWQGSNAVVASGRIFLIDPTPAQVSVVDNFTVILDNNRPRTRVRSELLVTTLEDNCLSFGDLAVEPEFVDCTDANRTQPFVIYNATTGDSLAGGLLNVRDTSATALECVDTLGVTLSENGFPSFFRPDDVIVQLSDNCVSPGDLYVTPQLLDCGAVDTLTTYELKIEATDETLCQGTIRLRDESLPVVTCAGDLTVEIPANKETLTLDAEDLITRMSDNCLEVSDLLVSPNLNFTCDQVGDTIAYTILTPDFVTLCGGNVIVQDERNESLSCEPSVTIDLPDNSFERPVVLDDVLLNDNLSCATSNDLQLTPISVNCGTVGSTVPYVLYSTSRQDTVCTGTISVVDTSAPEITCRDTVEVFQNRNGRPVNVRIGQVLESFADNCLTENDLTVQIPSIPCFVGNAELDYVVEATGGDTLCRGVVLVRDTFPLLLECKDTLQVMLNADGSMPDLKADNAVESITDNCFSLNNLYLDIDEFDCTDIGDESLTYTVRADFINRRMCSGKVQVIDETPPVVTCQDTFMVELGMNGAAPAPSLDQLMTGFTDNCSSPSTLTLEVADSFFCADQSGLQKYRILLADDTEACVGSIQVADANAPAITCQSDVVELFLPEDSDAVSITADLFLTSFGDNCSSADVLAVQPSVVRCDQSGDTLTYTITWPFTGEVLCTGDFVVRDTTPPAPVCMENISYNLPVSGSSKVLSASDVILSLNDNCATFDDFTLDMRQPGCEDVDQAIPYQLLFTETGETVCSGSVSVMDTLPLSIECKQQAVYVLPEGDVPSVIFPEVVIESFSDNCFGINDLRLTPSNYDCAEAGQPLPYNLTVAATGDTLCSGVLTIIERQAPVVSCKENVTVRISEVGDNIDISPGDVITGIDENCTSIFGLSASITPAVVGCDEAGRMIPYTVTVEDASRNKGRCNGTITVLDDMDPVAVCKDSMTVELSRDGFTFLNPRTLDAGSTDNCNSPFELRYNLSPALFNCDDVDQTFDVTLRVRDRAGNQSTCESVVSVVGPQDTMAVEIISPQVLDCNSTAVYRANVINGGFFMRYRWQLVSGADRGWRIISSISSRNIRLQTGEGEVKLAVTAENIGGCSVTTTITENCNEGVAGGVAVLNHVAQNGQDTEMTLFPNPTDDRLQVRLPQWQGELSYRIHNMQGVLVRQVGTHYVDLRDEVDVSQLPPGTYMLTVDRADQAPLTRRFVKR